MADSAPSSSNHPILIDRLSNLPEHILLHILSFLPTKMAVKTSVLSKPFQHLWTLVPAIDLFYYGFPRPKTFEDSLISKVLDGNQAPIIRRFRLRSRSCSTSYLGKWLSSATDRNVEELDLDINNVYVDLYFPSLKILHLKGVRFERREPSLSGFFSSRFPLLEELVVVDCSALHRDLNISLPKLRRLEIQFIKKCTLNMEVPSLQYLVLRFCDTRGFLVGNLLNLVEANVDVFYNTRGREDEESLMNKDDEYGESLTNFVDALSNARMLNLSLNTMQTLSSHSLFRADRIQSFHNLVELDLLLVGSLLGITMIMLSKFVNLEHLKMTERTGYRSECNETKTEYCLAPPTHVPNCLTYRLKTFCLEHFTCSKHEMEFTIYILKNSLVLENVKIIFRPRLVWKKGCDSKKILSKSSRGSLECKLEFDQKVSESEYIDSYSDFSE